MFLTGRRAGAESAFYELLRLRPATTLDPRTTRPDVVAFFEDVRRRHALELRDAHPKSPLLNLLPPFGQFQNGNRGRGYSLAALEGITLAVAVTTDLLLRNWQHPDHTFDDNERARSAKVVNNVALAAFVGTYLFGILDGFIHYGDPIEDPTEPPPPTRFSLAPNGLALTF